MKRIVIVTEVINRELDNAILLKCILQKRGYDVKIMSKTEQISSKKTDLLLIPNCYNTENYEFYRYRFNCKSGRIVSMQYEQVLSKYSIDSEFYKPTGRANKVLQLCWGKNSYKRLLNYGVREDKLKIVGAIQLDTVRNEFSGLWKSKKQLASEYSIPEDKKWMLYISSFSCAQDNVIQDKLRNVFSEDRVERFKQVSAISQRDTLKWFDKFLETHDDIMIIYRPHPVELNSPLVKKIMKKYPEQFRCINDLGIKQWIKVCDIISTWFSTSVVESFMMKKNCLIIRPTEIPYIDECEIYYKCGMLKTYEEMVCAVENYRETIDDFSIPVDDICLHYDIQDIPTYVRIADIIESEMDNEGDKEKNFVFNRIWYLIKTKAYLRIWIKKVYQIMYRKLHIKVNNSKLRNKFFIEEWEKSVDNSINNKKDIKEKINIISKII